MTTTKSSNIILLNDGLYEFVRPALPKENEIWGYDAKPKDQYWKTPHSNNKWLNPDGSMKDVKKMKERDRIEYIDYFRNIWLNGLYIMVNGEPVYLTGLHAEHLLFNTYNSQKLMFFYDEINIFYFIDITERAPECEGRCWIKPRRAKMTTIMCSLAQRKLLRDFSNYVTLQSDTLDKAQKSYMSPIIDSYTRRPIWLREQYYSPNGKKPRKALELTSNVIQEEGNDWLGGKINIFPTTTAAVDGLEGVESVIDEFSKHTDTSPYELFEVLRKVIQNFRKQGKIDCLSSTGDSKEAAKATMDWHKLIANSNPLKKDRYGKTVSGLWKYFISAIHSQYVPKEFTDIYGKVNKEKAEEWVWNEIKKYPEGTKEYIFALYKLPLKEEHALLSAAVHNLFDKVRIMVRLEELEGMLIDEKPYVRGRFEEDVRGNVYFEPDPTGYWLVAIHPFFSVEKGIDLRNRYRKIDGVFFPPVNPEGVIGYDAINFPKGLVKSNNLSQACAVAHKKYDYYNTGIEDEKMAFLLYRPDDPHDANKEIMKACKYYGYPCMHERSASHPYEDFRDGNMLPFLMKADDGIHGTLPNAKNVGDGIAMLKTRYATPKSEDQKDYIAAHPFEDALRSHYNFDPANTTSYDPTMAEIQLEHGLKKLPFTNQTDESSNNKLKVAKEIFAPRNR